ncbi:Icc protein [Parabacteroides sp. PFB2-10]|uniref:metallophosphoesterase family protein n=1 Tax=Parabacteroides sp. PFB2-10 TaxID=1742405 RepID=UPI0024758A76|nr:metallophosphoesterase [Parabacteroides sp. PFB2-10]MDH6313328.1 Icc protein [Parabacteroides sp. PFB2-10]MDL2244836.1 metallophosphoesterase [Parabacteroides sp. OttesenSCG-928-J18]
MKRFVYTTLTLTLCLLFGCTPEEQTVRFLLFSDLHADSIADGSERLQTILRAGADRQVDFFVDLGDIAQPSPANEPLREMLINASAPVYHAIGSQDLQKASKQEFTAFYGLKASHYYFDKGPFRFVVLDSNFFLDEEGNEQAYDHGNFDVPELRHGHFSQEQHEWLTEVLKNKKPIYVILSHAPINDRISTPNKNRDLHRIIKEAMNSGTRIAAVMAGYNHSDNYQVIDRINYWQANSASYFWTGNDFVNRRSGREPLPEWPEQISYDTTLYAIIEINSQGTITIKGMQGGFVDPTIDREQLQKRYPFPISSSIKDRELTY